MKKRRACLLLVLVFILVCIYWNIKPSTSRNRPSNKITGHREVDFEVGHQTFSHEWVDNSSSSKPHTRGKNSFVPTQVVKNMYSLLRQRLFQLELQLNESKLTSKVIFMGPLDVLKAETPLYKASLQIHRHEIEEITDVKSIINTSQWSGVFCYNTENNHETMTCLGKHEYTRLKLFQKISFFQGLDKLFNPPKHFCYTMMQTKHISALSNSPLSAPCYVISPKSKQNLPKHLLTSNNNGSVLVVQTRSNLFTFREETLLDRSIIRLQDNSILQVIKQPFQVDGLPVVIKVYVIITSISPLRIYRHSDGCALIMALGKKENIKESWTLPQFKIYLNKHSTVYNPHSVWDHVDKAIVHTIMVSESLLSSSDLASSKNGFQVLEFYFALNSSLYPFLIKVKPPDPGSTLPAVANDIVSIVFTTTSSYNHVTEILSQLADNTGVEGINCLHKSKICLSNKELIYLIEGHRENISKGRFKKLYPTNDRHRYHSILSELRSSSVGMVTYLNTPRLHNVLSLLENYGNQGTDSVVTKNYSKRKEHLDAAIEDESANEKKLSLRNHISGLGNCTDDPDKAPVLTDIIVNPEGRFNQAFDKEIKEYELAYPFSVMVIKLWGKTSSCWSALTVNGNTKSLNG